MALRIIFTDTTEAYWTIDSKEYYMPDHVKCIVADDKELLHIKELFLDGHRGNVTIPIAWEKPTMRWYGDIAKTIVANL